MIFWQHKASKEPARLAERLFKYTGGQILLNTKGETLRGEITDYEEKGSVIAFRLRWLAKKRVISPSRFFRKGAWKWELTHSSTLPKPLDKIVCAIHLEIQNGEERGPEEETEEPITQAIEVDKFHQNKQWRIWRFQTKPKCLFFSTKTPNERGVLFQPHDPRNLRLEDGEIVDPYAPKQPKAPPK